MEALLLFFNLSRTDLNKNTLCFISSEKPQTNVRMGKVCRQNKQMALVQSCLTKTSLVSIIMKSQHCLNTKHSYNYFSTIIVLVKD